MGNYVWPCPQYSRVSSPFGNRTCPFHGKEFHSGVDLAAASGAPILAARPGTVRSSFYNGSYGNYIELDHGGGVTTRYAHASKLLVSAGQTVTAGQKIALVGTTGSSTGNHLHFEVRENGTAKNPLNYVKASDTVSNFSGNASRSNSGTVSVAKKNKKKPERKEITTVIVKSVTGGSGVQSRDMLGAENWGQSGVEILVQNDKIYLPVIEGEIKLSQYRKGSPSKLEFTVMKDDVLSFQEGNPVAFRYNGINVFYGFVFAKRRKDLIKVSITCYDQMRYLKNKDTLSYANKTYGQLVQMIAQDYGLKCGEIDDTKFVIQSRIEDGTLLDMLANASDLTVLNTGNLFVLYDDFGYLKLKNIQSMKLPIMVDEDTAESFDYTSSIDRDTYTRIKLAIDNSTTGEREVHVLNDEKHQREWGILQYYEKVESGTAAQLKEKAAVLLNYYNQKQRTLKISGVWGDVRVRGGSSLVVKMGLGDINVQNYMVVEEVAHKWENGSYTMDISLAGIRGEKGVFVT